MAYDVIIVGARVAGAATALLLARTGARVLVLDRAGFPSDTVSSHQVQVPGIALLHAWGLRDALAAAGTPATRRVRFDAGPGTVIEGEFPSHRGVDELRSPRRTVLDKLLVDAARAAGAEVREHVRVEELLWEHGRVVGVRARGRDRRAYDEHARYVVGADGKHSFVAQAVAAPAYREHAPRAFACYGYWSGLPMTHGEVHQRPGAAAAVFPTNDDLTMVYISAPMGEFDAFRGDIEAAYLAKLALFGDLRDRVAAGARAERLRTTPDQPNRLRVPHGPGWALVGDAGVVMDSITAQGITNALHDADALAGTLARALAADAEAEAAFTAHHHARDRRLTPMYDLTVELARHAPGFGARRLLAAVAAHPAEAPRFLAAFAGITPPDAYFRPRTLLRLAVTPRSAQGSRRRPAKPTSWRWYQDSSRSPSSQHR